MTKFGVSVVVCCHNSARRLPQTLLHLQHQQVPSSINWEIILVDNVSTDSTAQVALGLWDSFEGVDFRVVSEPKVGLSNARVKGFQEARYEFVSFVDDDNWLEEDWVEKVYKLITTHPDVGACGGQNIPVFEVEPPSWFNKYQHHFAIGKQSELSEDITWSRGYLWGAGLTIRKKAWLDLQTNGFFPILTDRSGKQLTAGGDSEICFALRLGGWNLWSCPDIKLSHFIPKERMDWKYLRKMMRGFGISSVGHDPYKLASLKSVNKLKGRTGKIWFWKFRREMYKLISQKDIFLKFITDLCEGDDDILVMEFQLGRFFELLRKRDLYDRQVKNVLNAKWILKGNK